MDSIQGYNSDSDTEPETQDHLTLGDANHNNYTNHHLSPALPVEWDDITIYSQNYNHQLGMANLYFMIPWKPSFPVIRKLEAISTSALKFLKIHHFQFYHKYNWDLHAISKPNIRSKYDPLHITLGDNVTIPEDKLYSFVESFERGIKTLTFPPQVIKDNVESATRLNNLQNIFRVREQIIEQEDLKSDSENFESVLFQKHLINSADSNDPITKLLSSKSHQHEISKCIKLQFAPEFKLLPSSSSDCLFLGLKIHVDDDTQQFLSILNHYIRDHCQLFDIKDPTERGIYYHISMGKAVPKSAITNLHDELDKINANLLHDFHFHYFQQDLNSISINFDSINMITTSKFKSLYELQLPLHSR